VAVLLLLIVALLTGDLWSTTPSADDLRARVAAIGAAAGARPLTPEEVPPLLERAVVAVEDERFYVHHGLDTVGTARAALSDVTQRCFCEGGSTVTQQLAKTVYFADDGRIARKLPGMAVAFKIELRYGKPEIMADYLSVVHTGYNLVGARQASCAYFGHELALVTIAEAAQLAGSIQAPTAYDPRYHPALAAARRGYALDRMVAVGYITEAQALAAEEAPVLAGGVGHPKDC
jgi:membrane peptidoglycan carboxypeptidase